MNQEKPFHLLTVGWDQDVVERLCGKAAAVGQVRTSHLLHPRHTPHDCADAGARPNFHFFRQDLRQRMPSPDARFLALLEQDGVPTIHNMIMGDRVVSKLSHDAATAYATFLARRLVEVYEALDPSAVVGGFDGLHGGLAFAVARHLNIPWFALNFSVMPPGMACFCDRLSPAALVQLETRSDPDDTAALARKSLEEFEARAIQARAYIAPPPLNLLGKLGKFPARIAAIGRTLRDSRRAEHLRFTDGPGRFSVAAAVRHIRRSSAARKAMAKLDALETPPSAPYVLFGLHMQPESSIDVWAPFFSNQMWVIELIARSIPPHYRLLVKAHKSDIANYQAAELERMRSFPGVGLVKPFADTRSFIDNAGLVVSIQGTMGLEAALLGKPVIMLGESPVTMFPSVSGIGNITDLPALVRRKLGDRPPPRDQILKAYAAYLAPFLPASHNDWTTSVQAEEAGRYANIFAALERHLTDQHPVAAHP